MDVPGIVRGNFRGRSDFSVPNTTFLNAARFTIAQIQRGQNRKTCMTPQSRSEPASPPQARDLFPYRYSSLTICVEGEKILDEERHISCENDGDLLTVLRLGNKSSQLALLRVVPQEYLGICVSLLVQGSLFPPPSWSKAYNSLVSHC